MTKHADDRLRDGAMIFDGWGFVPLPERNDRPALPERPKPSERVGIFLES